MTKFNHVSLDEAVKEMSTTHASPQNESIEQFESKHLIPLEFTV